VEAIIIDGGGSCMVRVGFFDRFPIAATKLFSLEDATLSLDLECFIVGNGLLSTASPDEVEREDGASLEALDRDHHDFEWDGAGRVDMTEENGEGASWREGE
jgi:hypothetical protein